MKFHSTLLCVFSLLVFSTALLAGGGDSDGDGIPDAVDNCPLVANPAQVDLDADGIGDVCDPCPTDPTNTCNPCPDADADGICDANDNCPTVFNPAQVDTDGDLIGDVCDPCPNDALNDVDADGLCADVDNCPMLPNPGQDDCDGDGMGDACEVCPCDADEDIDSDFVCGDIDNCPFVANTAQTDTDADGVGDACDCDPLDPTAGPPAAVAGLVAGTMGGSTTRFAWQSTPFADRYDILQGSIANPGGAVCWTQQDPDPTDLEFVETAIPLPGDSWFYVIRGVDDACGGPGPWSDGSISATCP